MARSATVKTTDFEKTVMDKVMAGEPADLTSASRKPTVSGAFLAALALRTPPRGIQIRGAEVRGELNLANGTLPALLLEGCSLPDKIDVSGARLGQLSIKDSAFSYLHAKRARIENGFDFSYVRAVKDEAWIDAANTLIHGGVAGHGAKLKSPAARPKEIVPPWQHNYALRMSEATVHGNLMMSDGFVADGGFTMDDMFLYGSVRARGSTFIAGEGDAFHPGDCYRAHTAKISGHVEIGFGFRTVGRMWFLGAKIGDRFTIGMTESFMQRPKDTWDWANRTLNPTAALIGDQMRVDGVVNLNAIKIEGVVSFRDAKIGAYLQIKDCTISNKTPNGVGQALALENIETRSGIIFGPNLSLQGAVTMSGARIGGSFKCLAGVSFDNETKDGKGIAIDAGRIDVDHEVLPAGLAKGTPGKGATTKIKGRVNFKGARIGLRI